MTKYIAQRLALLIPTILLVTVIVFTLMRAMPGDAASLQIGDTASKDQIETLRRQLGLDRPVYQQYFVWIGGVLRGDFGKSHRSQQPVIDELKNAIPVSAELAVAGVITAVLVALPLGTLAATNRARHIDYVARLVALAGLSVPSFVLGTLVVLFLALWFGWLPPTGYVPLYVDPLTNVQQFVFPALVVGYRSSALMTRMVRSSLLDVLQQDYIRTAMSKGLSWPTVVTRHALRNALIPVVTLIGTQIGALLSGAVVTETIFSLPGVGRLFIQAVTQRDYAMVQVVILFIALVVSLSNLIVDLLYALVDPRVGYE
jgi:peptide/nickel transport system permease protein